MRSSVLTVLRAAVLRVLSPAKEQKVITENTEHPDVTLQRIAYMAGQTP